jgi:hypothetical protein
MKPRMLLAIAPGRCAGALAANFEGNEFTAEPLGDFIKVTMEQPGRLP